MATEAFVVAQEEAEFDEFVGVELVVVELGLGEHLRVHRRVEVEVRQRACVNRSGLFARAWLLRAWFPGVVSGRRLCEGIRRSPSWIGRPCGIGDTRGAPRPAISRL